MGWIRDLKSVRPDRPFFLHLAFGATHAPHQSPREYVEKYRGRFDDGWDAARERWFRRQLETGVVPEGTTLAPRNPGVLPWAELPRNQRIFAARLQEAFAAFLDHTDAQIGRLIAFFEAMGLFEDTLLIVLSDNGASQEGGPHGVMDEFSFFNLMGEDIDNIVAIILDATIIRMVLVPASMELLGDWNWYFPRWLEWLPEIHIEGGAVQAPGPARAGVRLQTE